MRDSCSKKTIKEEKMMNNNQYMQVLEKSDKQIREGNVVVKTMEELEEMAEE